MSCYSWLEIALKLVAVVYRKIQFRCQNFQRSPIGMALCENRPDGMAPYLLAAVRPGSVERWHLDLDNQALIRFHADYRSQLFSAPIEVRQKFPELLLTGRRKAWFKFREQTPDCVCDDVSAGARKLSKLWIGSTCLR